MQETHRAAALAARQLLERGQHDRAALWAALRAVPPADRDAWVDLVLGLESLPDDTLLPLGCVPYLPCPADVVLRTITEAQIRASDVFVDLGSGLGRVTKLVHLLTGAPAVGVEIQAALVAGARASAQRLRLAGVSYVQADAAELTRFVTAGSVYFLYCPFGGERLNRVLAQLRALAQHRRLERTGPDRAHGAGAGALRVCCVDLPLPAQDWLQPEPGATGDLAVYRALGGSGSAR